MSRRLLRLRSLLLAGIIWTMTMEEPGKAAPNAVPSGDPLPAMNMIIDASRDLASSAVYTTRATPEIVDEVINGAKVDGQGVSYSVSSALFLPDDRQAALEIVIDTRLATETQGVKDPVTTCNSTVAVIKVRKPVQITADGFSTQDACSAVSADLTLKDLTTKFKGLLDCLVKRIAYKRYDKEFDQTRAETEFKMGRKANHKVDQEVGEQIARGQKEYMEQFSKPLKETNLFPDPLLFRTSRDVLTAIGRLADEKDPPVIGPPPAVEGAPALAVRIHESLLNTAADRQYAGKTIRGSEVSTQLRQLGIKSGSEKETAPKGKNKEFEATFAREKPIRVALDHNTVRLTLRVANLRTDLSPEADEPNFTTRWETSVVYKLLDNGKGGIRLDRVGELKSVPLDENYKPITTKLSGFQVVERQRLHAELSEELFRKTLEIDELKPTGAMAKIGTLRSTQVGSAGGWLVLAWRRVPKPE
jgi:hypothetical protein